MDLHCSQSQRGCTSTTATALRDLQRAAQSWRPEIETYTRGHCSPSSVNGLMNEIRVNGRPLTAHFDAATLHSLLSILQRAMSDVDEVKSLLEDVIGMLCLLAAMCGDFKNLFLGNNAEESWKQLMKDANLLVENASSSYERHRQIYDQIFDLICRLLPPGVVFCVKVAATLFAFVWKHRHSIAAWIAANWQSVAIGVAAGVAAVALTGLAAYGISRLFSGDSSDSDSERRRRNN